MTPAIKILKTLDYVIQLGLIIGSVLYAILSVTKFVSGDKAFFAYFIVGGWQIMSVVAHLLYSPSYKSKLRKIYLIILAIVFVILLVSYSLQNDNIMLATLFGLLIVSPFQAILYVITCIRETKKWWPPAQVTSATQVPYQVND